MRNLMNTHSHCLSYMSWCSTGMLVHITRHTRGQFTCRRMHSHEDGLYAGFDAGAGCHYPWCCLCSSRGATCASVLWEADERVQV